MRALYVVCGKWILYCLFGCQLVQISIGNLKDFKVLNFLDFGKKYISGTPSNLGLILDDITVKRSSVCFCVFIGGSRIE